jgi:hypothetical protein
VERAEKPAQLLSSGRYRAGMLSSVCCSSGWKRPSLCTSDIAGEFSVRKTSAGLALPSVTSWLAISRSDPSRTSTSTPVFSVKSLAIGSISSACCAL